MLGSEPIVDAEHENAEVLGDPRAEGVIHPRAADDHPAAVNPQQRTRRAFAAGRVVDERLDRWRAIAGRELDGPADARGRDLVDDALGEGVALGRLPVVGPVDDIEQRYAVFAGDGLHCRPLPSDAAGHRGADAREREHGEPLSELGGVAERSSGGHVRSLGPLRCLCRA